MQKEVLGQREWGWNVAFYLFLAGVGAGAYATGVIADLLGEDYWFIATEGVMLGFPLVLMGTLFLIADLGAPARLLFAYLNPATSWIARGTIIITVFMVLGFLHIILWIWPLDWLEKQIAIRYTLGIVNLIFAVLTMIYTGILLGAARPIAMWSTAMLPLLFFVSAVSTGIMAVMFVLSIWALSFPEPTELIPMVASLTKVDMVLIAIELLVLFFYIQATHRVSESRLSCELLLKGRLAPAFWGVVVIGGLLVPLAIGVREVYYLPEQTVWDLMTIPILGVISSVFGLVGGLLLRYVILASGVRAPLRAGKFEYPLPVQRQ